MPGDQRLIKLLASVLDRAGDYALARLELGIRLPHLDLPPPLPCLASSSETTLRAQWGETEARLEEIGSFVRRKEGERDPAFLWLRRTYRELDQYSRALRWVLTVTERTTDESE